MCWDVLALFFLCYFIPAPEIMLEVWDIRQDLRLIWSDRVNCTGIVLVLALLRVSIHSTEGLGLSLLLTWTTAFGSVG